MNCIATTKAGKPCKNSVREGEDYCHIHSYLKNRKITSTTENQQNRYSRLRKIGGVAGIIAILGLIVTSLQLWQSLIETRNNERMQSTSIALQFQSQSTISSILEQQLEVQSKISNLQSTELSTNSQSTAIEEEIARLESTITALERDKLILQATSTEIFQNTNAYEALLTIASSPKPTPLPTYTIPGTVLEGGQTWYQNGLALTAKDFCVVGCLPESFEVTFIIESFLDQDILLPELLGEDMPLEFDTGETYLPWMLGVARINNIPSQRLPPNRPFEWTWEYKEDWNSSWWTPIGADTREFSLIVKRIGERIINANWSGEIPR